MKTLYVIMIVAFGAAKAKAATVVLTLTGRVSETDAALYFSVPPVSVGDPWTVTISYDFPRLPIEGSLLGSEEYGADSMVFQVNGLFWTGGLTYVLAIVETPSQRAEFLVHQDVPSAIGPAGVSSSTHLTFFGGNNLINDSSSLPDSFVKWNLPAATAFSLEVFSGLGPAPTTLWHIRANSWDTISIQVIPEPGAACLMAGAALAVAGSRRRIRS